MKTLLKCVALACALPLVSPVIEAVHAGNYEVRQYYSGWQKNTQANYYYRTYYYKPNTDYVGFKHQFVIYYPDKPEKLYFFNPYKKLFWGYCPSSYGGYHNDGYYSMLPEPERKANLADIPPSAFPKPTSVPNVPESTDGAKLDLPPDDLPSDKPDAALPKAS